MKMPELLLFVKSLATGFLGAEIWRIAFYLGDNFASALPDVPLYLTLQRNLKNKPLIVPWLTC